MNDRFQKALRREAQSVPPVWFMRQAGRYHRHYQALRKAHSFMDLCKNPKLAAEVALGPVQDFDFDVAILFSDLLFPLEMLGMGLSYDPAPALAWHLDEQSISKLRSADEAIGGLQFQKQAMIETRKVLPASKSLIGFVGGPWTLFGYAVDGSHKGGLENAKRLSHLYPKFSSIMVPLLQKNIELQFEGGAEVVMIFDTAAGELSPRNYREMIAPDLEKLARRFPGKLGLYSKGIGPDHYLGTGLLEKGLFAGYGIDHRWEMTSALKFFKSGFVQGCFDQSLLFLDPSVFASEVDAYLAPLAKLSSEERAGWVSGLGHGVLPNTPEVNVRNFVIQVRDVLDREPKR